MFIFMVFNKRMMREMGKRAIVDIIDTNFFVSNSLILSTMSHLHLCSGRCEIEDRRRERGG